jgi:hypothetical protein
MDILHLGVVLAEALAGPAPGDEDTVGLEEPGRLRKSVHDFLKAHSPALVIVGSI